MGIAITGASGLIGSAVVAELTAAGHRVTRLVRATAAGPDEARWDPETGAVDEAALEGVDGVVHLAGRNIASGRWTAAVKTEIRESRVGGTRLLCESLARLKRPPQVLISASAVGFYGCRGDAVLDEASPPGEGFLVEVCREWEAATQPAAERGIRVVLPRFGVVLSRRGGALVRMLRLFRFGLGGRVGDGGQYWSWVSSDDAAGAVLHLLMNPSLHGPVNVTAPEPVTNAEFTRTLARTLHRPALFPLPATVARLVLGEMADVLLLCSARVLPKKLLDAGYVFRHPRLAEALAYSSRSA
jgi:uncharacterized protein (TIGR01777 family)